MLLEPSAQCELCPVRIYLGLESSGQRLFSIAIFKLFAGTEQTIKLCATTERNCLRMHLHQPGILPPLKHAATIASPCGHNTGGDNGYDYVLYGVFIYRNPAFFRISYG